jgi:hypothetical protein
MLPGLVNVNKRLWKITMLSMGKSTINGPFSIAMLVYQRVLDGSSQQLNYNSRKFIGVRGNVQVLTEIICYKGVFLNHHQVRI